VLSLSLSYVCVGVYVCVQLCQVNFMNPAQAENRPIAADD